MKSAVKKVVSFVSLFFMLWLSVSPVPLRAEGPEDYSDPSSDDSTPSVSADDIDTSSSVADDIPSGSVDGDDSSISSPDGDDSESDSDPQTSDGTDTASAPDVDIPPPPSGEPERIGHTLIWKDADGHVIRTEHDGETREIAETNYDESGRLTDRTTWAQDKDGNWYVAETYERSDDCVGSEFFPYCSTERKSYDPERGLDFIQREIAIDEIVNGKRFVGWLVLQKTDFGSTTDWDTVFYSTEHGIHRIYIWVNGQRVDNPFGEPAQDPLDIKDIIDVIDSK